MDLQSVVTAASLLVDRPSKAPAPGVLEGSFTLPISLHLLSALHEVQGEPDVAKSAARVASAVKSVGLPELNIPREVYQVFDDDENSGSASLNPDALLLKLHRGLLDNRDFFALLKQQIMHDAPKLPRVRSRIGLSGLVEEDEEEEDEDEAGREGRPLLMKGTRFQPISSTKQPSTITTSLPKDIPKAALDTGSRSSTFYDDDGRQRREVRTPDTPDTKESTEDGYPVTVSRSWSSRRAFEGPAFGSSERERNLRSSGSSIGKVPTGSFSERERTLRSSGSSFGQRGAASDDLAAMAALTLESMTSRDFVARDFAARESREDVMSADDDSLGSASPPATDNMPPMRRTEGIAIRRAGVQFAFPQTAYVDPSGTSPFTGTEIQPSTSLSRLGTREALPTHPPREPSPEPVEPTPIPFNLTKPSLTIVAPPEYFRKGQVRLLTSSTSTVHMKTSNPVYFQPQ
eukprot:TRINITY_DN3127_c0_g1_i2.p1 TRINITY_DN3127_c0_g1~~TRINITY_DN3127_c0_g1_i2.p1  ORF type:complete len:460 (-),score=148.18 TRINITY_DN3127_c0_g1_i2:425-1804(-)